MRPVTVTIGDERVRIADGEVSSRDDAPSEIDVRATNPGVDHSHHSAAAEVTA